MRERLRALIPGAAHTYAKGDDQWPEFDAPVISHGEGAEVVDVDGNRYIEFGSGLRSVTLGHTFWPVIEAVEKSLRQGTNFVRPAAIELEAAEAFLQAVPTMDMVKFAKNGSDADSGAVRLARAITGRDLVAICVDHPFFSVDDWFMGSTTLDAGIPASTRAMTLKFRYNDVSTLEQLFAEFPDQIAAVVMEVEKVEPPQPGFLESVRRACDQHGALLVFDEIVTGFRWSTAGAHSLHGVVPDLSTWGKGMANGFSVAALAGKREYMERGGLDHAKERIFLLSYTNAAETPSLAAAIATMGFYAENPVIETLAKQGDRLAAGLRTVAKARGVEDQFTVFGRGCGLLYGTKDQDGNPSQPFRTLFLQETVKRGLLAPSLFDNYSHTDELVDRTIEIVDEALVVYARALEDGWEEHVVGRPVAPVMRRFNRA
ncbi:glutamate-1-semialdehyde 2,1-aminomutase [soil metagenome]